MLQHHAIAMQPYDGKDAGTPLAASAWVEIFLVRQDRILL